MTVIEPDNATLADRLDTALSQGAQASGVLAAAAEEIGAAFRRADPGEASRRLAEFGDGIRSLVWLIGAVASARDVSLEQMAGNGRPMSVDLAELTAQLKSIIEAQEAADWLTLADILEYDLQPALQAWQQVFESLRTMGSQPS